MSVFPHEGSTVQKSVENNTQHTHQEPSCVYVFMLNTLHLGHFLFWIQQPELCCYEINLCCVLDSLKEHQWLSWASSNIHTHTHTRVQVKRKPCMCFPGEVRGDLGSAGLVTTCPLLALCWVIIAGLGFPLNFYTRSERSLLKTLWER